MPADCSPSVLDPYVDTLVAIYDNIHELRDGKPVIIQGGDAYLPHLSKLRRWGNDVECTACWENYYDAIHRAAEERDVPVASIFDAFNGLAHDQDPWETGLIGNDLAHTTEAGQEAIAQVFRSLGYYYSTP